MYRITTNKKINETNMELNLGLLSSVIMFIIKIHRKGLTIKKNKQPFSTTLQKKVFECLN